jgi:hypothetical protein
MNNLTEIKNHKVLYEGGDGKLILPLNFGAIKELAPWIEHAQPHVLNRLKGDVGFPYILLTNGHSYVILDKGSKMPTLYSGNYELYSESSYNPGSVHKLLSHKKELIDFLKLKYTPKQRIKFNMPYSDEELTNFSNKNQFAKALYNVIKSDSTTRQKNIDKLYNFLGEYVVVKGDPVYGRDSDDWEEIEFNDDDIELITSDSLYKEKYVSVEEDDSWAFDTAMSSNHYSDCEEMDSEELGYIDYHMLDPTNKRFVELVNKYEPNYWQAENISPDITSREEGIYDNFLTQYFPDIWEKDSWEVLDGLGCAVWRARRLSVLDEINDEITYEIVDSDYGPQGKFITRITYPQLLQLVGSLGIKNFGELREWDINEISYNLTDTWYDGWDVDEQGIEDINSSMMEILNLIDRTYNEKYEETKQNINDFHQIMEDLEFKKQSYGWHNRYMWVKFIPTSTIPSGHRGPEPSTRMTIKDFNPMDNDVEMTIADDGTVKGNPKKIDVEDIVDEVTKIKNKKS